uniref:AlNc14C173G8043 protein n=1 Tax=Albugo laibachii Nc14 TaxID=890382 RepID=F0WNM2_9STRA|nr:AlNc14C173G8043 [Albugo laibachii Nc14]|eukprot:CCA22913.1 AlNc14C173G8043 [Albugo laibachii Nc14]
MLQTIINYFGICDYSKRSSTGSGVNEAVDRPIELTMEMRGDIEALLRRVEARSTIWIRSEKRRSSATICAVQQLTYEQLQKFHEKQQLMIEQTKAYSEEQYAYQRQLNPPQVEIDKWVRGLSMDVQLQDAVSRGIRLLTGFHAIPDVQYMDGFAEDQPSEAVQI